MACLNQAVLFVLTTGFISNVMGGNGVLYSRDGPDVGWENHFCFSYNSYFHPLPASKALANVTSLVDLSTSFGCSDNDYKGHNVKDSAVLLARNNCSFVKKALIAQNRGASAILVASDELIVPGVTNVSDYDRVKTTIVLVLWSTARELLTEGSHAQVLLYVPKESVLFDPNMLVLFFTAVACITIGGFSAGVRRHKIYLKRKHALERKSAAQNQESEQTDVETNDDDEEDNIDLTIPVIIVFIGLVCGFLVLLYFFYDYLVFVVIGLFCLAGSLGLYFCAHPLWRRLLPFDNTLPVKRIPCFRSVPEYRNLLLAGLCVALAVFWAVQRHAPYAWVFQDILGFCFCINIMNNVHMPNMKICTLTLVLLFLYDIFFVFISPLFTSNGESIMVKVATGGSGSGSGKPREQLPMAYIVPKLTWEDINVCPLPYSLLGFGDIVVPALLVCHNHAFDLKVGSRKIYFILSIVAYAVGLLLTFGALAIMEKGQPALLYIVPCTLLTTFLIGWIRGEVRLLWSGIQVSISDEEKAENQPSPSEAAQENQTAVAAGTDSDSALSSDGEGRQLLRK